MALAFAAIWAVRFADRICRPLESFVHASEQISRGNLDQPALVNSNVKEVRELAAAQEEMRSALRSLLKHQRDLQVAREIQQSTFPQDFPSVDNFEIAGWSEPAEETGGDTFDLLAVISDGIFEATDSQGEQFGAERVAGLLQSLHESSADEILDAVRNSVDQYTGGVAASDDRTIIIVKCVKD